jgi:hypothetical protein
MSKEVLGVKTPHSPAGMASYRWHEIRQFPKSVSARPFSYRSSDSPSLVPYLAPRSILSGLLVLIIKDKFSLHARHQAKNVLIFDNVSFRNWHLRAIQMTVELFISTVGIYPYFLNVVLIVVTQIRGLEEHVIWHLKRSCLGDVVDINGMRKMVNLRT